ncbi:hypothetical protein [Rhizobium sp. BG4]|uniref:hypothetical protein n=1 Tax=Rhizobium sp. BG4 TaxID=2613770 RepID=UPI00193D8EF7|nr:hypothetical protein [Rhizobium sp. BG4]QRM44599.1 hypothetical protein F2982_14800 [Rhizobium sp. BG4]
MSVIYSREVARKIARRRAGLGFLDHRRPRPEPISGMQDAALRRKVRLPEERLVLAPASALVPSPASARVPAPAPGARRVVYDRTAGIAKRRPPLKNMKTARGWTYHKGNIVYHESETEHRVALRIGIRNDVAELHSQAVKFQHSDDDGREHDHIADFLVIYDDGYKQAVLVKHEEKREEMEALIERIYADPSSRQVDEIILRTERYGTIEAAENAMMIRWSREYHNQLDVDELLKVVLGLKSGWFRFGSLLRNCSSIERRRVAVWRLIDVGVLFSPTGEKITELSFLGFAPEGGATGLRG